MQLEFSIIDQTLQRDDTEKPVSNSTGYLKAHFNIPSEYTGTITAYFKKLQDGIWTKVPYVVDRETGLTNYLDDVVSDASGRDFNVYVSLSCTDTNLRIPTNQETVTVYTNGETGAVLPLPGSSENQYDEIVRMYNEIKAQSGGTGSGTAGLDGKSIEYQWNGTSLGIRQEGETVYQYVDLQGPKGDTFTFADFTPEQLATLKGDKGDAFTYSDFTPEQLLSLKGDKGDAFTYADFTASQLETLKGIKGDPGTGVNNIKTGTECKVSGPWTQAEYNALGTYDSTVFYFIVG